MARPKLSFFCELEIEPLESLLTEEVIQRLVSLKATVCLGIDRSQPGAGCRCSTLEPVRCAGCSLASAAQRPGLLVKRSKCPTGF